MNGLFTIISVYATSWKCCAIKQRFFLLTFDTTEYYGGIMKSLSMRVLWNHYHPISIVGNLLTRVDYDYYRLKESLS